MADFPSACNPVISPSEFKKSMSDEAKDRPEKTIRGSVDLPESIVKRFDELKEKWGLQRRGAVLERLLETLFEEEKEESSDSNDPRI